MIFLHGFKPPFSKGGFFDSKIFIYYFWFLKIYSHIFAVQSKRKILMTDKNQEKLSTLSVSRELREQVSVFCKERGLIIRPFVEKVIEKAITEKEKAKK